MVLNIKHVEGYFEEVDGVVLDEYWITDENGNYIPKCDMISGTTNDKKFLSSFFKLYDQLQNLVGKGLEICGNTFVFSCSNGGGSWTWHFYIDKSGKFIKSVTVDTDEEDLYVERTSISRDDLIH